MIKKFKCVACGKKFDADDKDSIVCPKCHSDNVTPVKPNYIKPLGIILALIISIGAGMFVTKQFKGMVKANNEYEEEYEEKDSLDKDTTRVKRDINPELLNAIEIENTKPVFDKVTRSYSFSVSATNVPEGAIVLYELCKEYDPNYNIKNCFDKSNDGKFNQVPASTNEDKTYYVVVTVKRSDGSLLDSKDRKIGGFDPVVPNVKKITKDALQKMINKNDESLRGGNPSISNNVSIVVQNSLSGERVQTFQHVFNYLKAEVWESVSVVSVSYDSENHLTKVVLSVKRGESTEL